MRKAIIKFKHISSQYFRGSDNPLGTSPYLVLSTDFLQLQHRLVVCILDAEQLRRNVASLLLGNVQIHTEAVHLMLPFANNAVKLLGLLLHSSVENLSLVQLLCHIGSIRSCLCLRLLQLLQLQAKLLNCGLALGEASLKPENMCDDSMTPAMSDLSLLHLGHL